MAMEKKGVVSYQENNIEVIGVKAENGAKICENCKRIVMFDQIRNDEECPFCNATILKD